MADGTANMDVQTGGVAADRLRSFIERVENLEEEKTNIMNDIKEVF
ncbi:MAG: GapR family DNA-binding domain-containing protein, partial [Pseudomonadota bacterium]